VRAIVVGPCIWGLICLLGLCGWLELCEVYVF